MVQCRNRFQRKVTLRSYEPREFSTDGMTEKEIEVRTSRELRRVTSRTRTDGAEAANINTIMRKYRATGYLVDPVIKPLAEMRYGDFSLGTDFRIIQERIALAKSNFARLSSEVRERFHNDVSELLDFLADPENAAEAVKLGLREPEDQEPSSGDAAPVSDDPEVPVEEPVEVPEEPVEEPGGDV